jgi:hypothetical protein
MKLFMFYIGGDCGNSNIELHDVRFSAGDTAEACHDDLRRQWWGNPKSLHLDCWGAVEQADGYDVMLMPPRSENSLDKLFFLNLGGYDPEHFEELPECPPRRTGFETRGCKVAAAGATLVIAPSRQDIRGGEVHRYQRPNARPGTCPGPFARRRD